MIISEEKIKRIIREEIYKLNESSAEYTQWLSQLVSPESILSINKRLKDIEDSLELMGGEVISFKNKIEDIEVEKEKDRASFANVKGE